MRKRQYWKLMGKYDLEILIEKFFNSEHRGGNKKLIRARKAIKRNYGRLEDT
jgi:hypothetical protein